MVWHYSKTGEFTVRSTYYKGIEFMERKSEERARASSAVGEWRICEIEELCPKSGDEIETKQKVMQPEEVLPVVMGILEEFTKAQEFITPASIQHGSADIIWKLPP
ncbi:hypothetical protein M9H77_05018 [Catharanthus roseus]|uniref:Uncharacterized protein n=1 Tax=Catharanthus roseus TaxID=4058 RepID=A0ACC0CFW6_CATRO|nr:hypothetical protein M9H77_05018 [Catharanthus roseus]